MLTCMTRDIHMCIYTCTSEGLSVSTLQCLVNFIFSLSSFFSLSLNFVLSIESDCRRGGEGEEGEKGGEGEEGEKRGEGKEGRGRKERKEGRERREECVTQQWTHTDIICTS